MNAFHVSPIPVMNVIDLNNSRAVINLRNYEWRNVLSCISADKSLKIELSVKLFCHFSCVEAFFAAINETCVQVHNKIN